MLQRQPPLLLLFRLRDLFIEERWQHVLSDPRHRPRKKESSRCLRLFELRSSNQRLQSLHHHRQLSHRQSRQGERVRDSRKKTARGLDRLPLRCDSVELENRFEREDEYDEIERPSDLLWSDGGFEIDVGPFGEKGVDRVGEESRDPSSASIELDEVVVRTWGRSERKRGGRKGGGGTRGIWEVELSVDDVVANDGRLCFLNDVGDGGRFGEDVGMDEDDVFGESTERGEKSKEVGGGMVLEFGSNVESLGGAVDDSPGSSEPVDDLLLQLQPEQPDVPAGHLQARGEEVADRVVGEVRTLDLDVLDEGFDVGEDDERSDLSGDDDGVSCMASCSTDCWNDDFSNGERPGLLPERVVRRWSSGFTRGRREGRSRGES